MNQEAILEKVRLSLESVGYKPGLIKRDYKYYDFYKTGKTNSIPLACFAHRDSNFRNACIGVVLSNGLSGRENIGRHISLGTPLFFEILENRISEWKLEKKTDVEPVQIGQFDFSEIDEIFEKNKYKWMPDTVMKARNFHILQKNRQLDFVDIGCFEYLDGILHKKFDELLKDIIHNTKSRIHSEPTTQNSDYKDIFRLIFRFISAKVLYDKNHPLQWDWNNAASVLSAVENYYSINDDISKFILANQGLPEQTWEQIKNSISFNNLSVNDLAYIYENSFITNETRKEFGTHSTPYQIADYIVDSLPFENLEQEQRRVFEPCSGHGIFLVSALRRLKDLLPSEMTTEEIHTYLINHLSGMEIDPFAIEVSRLCLTLADFPNPDGWDLTISDVFKSPDFITKLRQSDVVLCNPPFENRKDGIVLDMILKHPPSMLGFILSRSFVNGNRYKTTRHELIKSYSEIEIVHLPDKVFNKSDQETVMVLATKRQKAHKTATLSQKVFENKDKDLFLEKKYLPETATKTIRIDTDDSTLWIPNMNEIWDYLKCNKVFKDYVEEAHRGLAWITGSTNRVCDIDPGQSNYRAGHYRLKNYSQYAICENEQFLSFNESTRYNNSFLYDWTAAKIVCNSARVSRSPWRLTAVFDTRGLAFSYNFRAFWLKTENNNIEQNLFHKLIAAILNSPLSNAYMFDHNLDKHNRIEVFRRIPLPDFSQIDLTNFENTYNSLISNLFEPVQDKEAVNTLLLKIDALILAAYDLPPRLEKKLLDIFKGHQRPVPVEFTGYYTEGYASCTPLKEYISENFQMSRGDKILTRYNPVNDPIISEILEWSRLADE